MYAELSAGILGLRDRALIGLGDGKPASLRIAQAKTMLLAPPCMTAEFWTALLPCPSFR